MHGLTDSEVEQMLLDSYDHAQEDFDASRIANLRVEIGTMTRAVEAHLASAHDLDKETVADIEDAVAAAAKAVQTADVSTIQAARDELERATLPLAAALMDSVAKQALQGKTLDQV